MDENITAKNFSRQFSGIQHTILRWNDKELDDGLFVNVFPINYELCTMLCLLTYRMTSHRIPHFEMESQARVDDNAERGCHDFLGHNMLIGVVLA